MEFNKLSTLSVWVIYHYATSVDSLKKELDAISPNVRNKNAGLLYVEDVKRVTLIDNATNSQQAVRKKSDSIASKT